MRKRLLIIAAQAAPHTPEQSALRMIDSARCASFWRGFQEGMSVSHSMSVAIGPANSITVRYRHQTSSFTGRSCVSINNGSPARPLPFVPREMDFFDLV